MVSITWGWGTTLLPITCLWLQATVLLILLPTLPFLPSPWWKSSETFLQTNEDGCLSSPPGFCWHGWGGPQFYLWCLAGGEHYGLKVICLARLLLARLSLGREDFGGSFFGSASIGLSGLPASEAPSLGYVYGAKRKPRELTTMSFLRSKVPSWPAFFSPSFRVFLFVLPISSGVLAVLSGRIRETYVPQKWKFLSASFSKIKFYCFPYKLFRNQILRISTLWMSKL